MKTGRISVLFAGVAAAVLMSQSAQAVLVGKGNPTPSSIENLWAVGQVIQYNECHPGTTEDLPVPRLRGWDKTDDVGGDIKCFEYTVPEGCDFVYLITKWGGGRKAKVDTLLHYLTAGQTIKIMAPAGKGLSHYLEWTGCKRVPDGGSAVILLGMALMGVGLVRRRMRV